MNNGLTSTYIYVSKGGELRSKHVPSRIYGVCEVSGDFILIAEDVVKIKQFLEREQPNE